MSIYTPYSQNSILKKSMAILNLVWNTHLTHPILSTPLSFLRHWGIMFVFFGFLELLGWNTNPGIQAKVVDETLWCWILEANLLMVQQLPYSRFWYGASQPRNEKNLFSFGQKVSWCKWQASLCWQKGNPEKQPVARLDVLYWCVQNRLGTSW